MCRTFTHLHLEEITNAGDRDRTTCLIKSAVPLTHRSASAHVHSLKSTLEGRSSRCIASQPCLRSCTAMYTYRFNQKRSWLSLTDESFTWAVKKGGMASNPGVCTMQNHLDWALLFIYTYNSYCTFNNTPWVHPAPDSLAADFYHRVTSDHCKRDSSLQRTQICTLSNHMKRLTDGSMTR